MILALLCRRLGRISLAFLAGFLFFLLAFPLSAQNDDPSEIFLKAYLSAQQGEKLEHEDRFRIALAKLRFAGSLIEQLRRSYPDWQPAIVEYRGRKIGEGILRVQERISRHNELTASASPLPEVVPSLPEGDTWSEPGPEVVAPQGFGAISEGSSDAAIEEATKKLRHKVDELQAALEKSRSDVETTQKEIETSKQSEHEARDQLAQTQASLKALQISLANSTPEQLRAQIADLKNEVAAAKEARATAEGQRDETYAKLAEANEQIAAVAQQHDEALAQLKAGSEKEQHTLALLAENGGLKQNQANAEELTGLKQEVTQLQQRLTDSEKQNQYLVARIAELWVQLDETGAQLQSAKRSGKSSDETDQLVRENELLRNIVVRERQEEARRDEARKLVLTELGKLQIKSDALNKEIEILAQPVTKLTSQELGLLRQPAVSVSDHDRGALTASFIFAKQSQGNSADAEPPTKNSNESKEDVHDDPQSVAHAAKENLSGPITGQEKAMAESSGQGSE